MQKFKFGKRAKKRKDAQNLKRGEKEEGRGGKSEKGLKKRRDAEIREKGEKAEGHAKSEKGRISGGKNSVSLITKFRGFFF